MPNELRLRQNFAAGDLSAALTSTSTSLFSPQFAALLVIGTTTHLMLVLDPGGINGTPEIVQVTAHAASATTVTVLRGQEGSTARVHLANTRWAHTPLTSDLPSVYQQPLALTTNNVPVNSIQYNGGNLNRYMSSGLYNGSGMVNTPGGHSQWMWVQVLAHANGAHWQRQIAYCQTVLPSPVML